MLVGMIQHLFLGLHNLPSIVLLFFVSTGMLVRIKFRVLGSWRQEARTPMHDDDDDNDDDYDDFCGLAWPFFLFQRFHARSRWLSWPVLLWPVSHRAAIGLIVSFRCADNRFFSFFLHMRGSGGVFGLLTMLIVSFRCADNRFFFFSFFTHARLRRRLWTFGHENSRTDET